MQAAEEAWIAEGFPDGPSDIAAIADRIAAPHRAKPS
jgi:hypothetical protein